MSDDRPCTCHPSEAPVPCQKKYAFSECENAALRAELTAERDALRATISSELDAAIQSQSWDEVIAVRDHLDAALKGDGKD